MGRAAVFASELLGTFGLLVAATGSIAYDASIGSPFGLPFIALMHFLGLAVLVFIFGRYSMAHFNPAVTAAFVATGHLRASMVPLYLTAQCIGAFLGSLLVMYVIGYHGNLGMTVSNESYQTHTILGIEVLATALLMGVIFLVVRKKDLHAGIAGAAIGGIVMIDVLLFGPISGASMNPIRSLAPAIMTGMQDELWIYFVGPLLGSIAVAVIYRVCSR